MVIIATAFSSSYAAESDEDACRENVVQAAAYFKVTLEKETLGTTSFESLNLTAEELNNLDSKAQKEIYDKLKPLELYAIEYQENLRRELGAILDYAYRFNLGYLLLDEIKLIQSLKDNLELACAL